MSEDESNAGLPSSAPDAPSERQAVPAAAPAPRPLWTWFLMPAAVIAGAGIIALAVWLTAGGDGGDGNERAAGAAPQAEPTVAPLFSEPGAAAPGSPQQRGSATTLLTAFTGYARQVGADPAPFQQCLLRPDHQQTIAKQFERGNQLGVSGTPTFFINNKMVVGAQPPALFEEVINAELRGSPTTLDGYSQTIRSLAATTPPRFAILAQKIDVTGAVIEGDRNARVMIVEFSDFQCPFCRRWNQDVLVPLRPNLGPNVALAFLHFPITAIHPNAANASVAAICAGEQGKFWEMHDLLFSRQDEWGALRN